MKQYAFRDAEFLTAREKSLVLKSWVRFLRNGMRLADFSDRLYKHLTLHCSFIAHYDRAVFYQTYFEHGEDTVRFLSQFDKRGECRSVEYGGTRWLAGDYEDLNRAMVEEGARYIPKLMEEATRQQRESDVAAARWLLAKHGLQPEDLA